MTALKAGLPLAVRQLFSFIAVVAWGLRLSPWGLRFSPRGLRFSPWGLRFSQRGLRFSPWGLRFYALINFPPPPHPGPTWGNVGDLYGI